MAMGMGRSGGSVAEINVAPMIDVLLVLLIIFMVIVPMTSRGLPALLAHPPRTHVLPSPQEPVVVEIASHPGAAPSYNINHQAIPHAAIFERLTEIYANRADRVLFVEGDDHVQFAEVADLIDIGRAANADRIGLLTPGSRPAE
jgi:biopolymer transport protein TolR